MISTHNLERDRKYFPPVVWKALLAGIPLWNYRRPSERWRGSLHYQSLATDSASPTVPRWGHLGLKSDILSNCIILLSMLMGYVIFHRSVPIIRAWLSQRDPPDVCDLLQLDLVFPSKPQQPGLTRTFQKQFLENWADRSVTATVGSTKTEEKTAQYDGWTTACGK